MTQKTDLANSRTVRSARTPSRRVATWLALTLGWIGVHRWYVHGVADRAAWLLAALGAVGVWGVLRVRAYGHDDRLAWVLLPLLGMAITAGTLHAIVYGLATRERWQQRFGGELEPEAGAWLAVLGAVLALMVGSTALIASIAYVTQRSFETFSPEPLDRNV